MNRVDLNLTQLLMWYAISWGALESSESQSHSFSSARCTRENYTNRSLPYGYTENASDSWFRVKLYLPRKPIVQVSTMMWMTSEELPKTAPKGCSSQADFEQAAMVSQTLGSIASTCHTSSGLNAWSCTEFLHRDLAPGCGTCLWWHSLPTDPFRKRAGTRNECARQALECNHRREHMTNGQRDVGIRWRNVNWGGKLYNCRSKSFLRPVPTVNCMHDLQKADMQTGRRSKFSCSSIARVCGVSGCSSDDDWRSRSLVLLAALISELTISSLEGCNFNLFKLCKLIETHLAVVEGKEFAWFWWLKENWGIDRRSETMVMYTRGYKLTTSKLGKTWTLSIPSHGTSSLAGRAVWKTRGDIPSSYKGVDGKFTRACKLVRKWLPVHLIKLLLTLQALSCLLWLMHAGWIVIAEPVLNDSRVQRTDFAGDLAIHDRSSFRTLSFSRANKSRWRVKTESL